MPSETGSLIKRGNCNRCGWICCSGCEQLDEKGLCKTYDSRPEGCRQYPHNPMALEEGCTLWFEEDGQKITPQNLCDFSEDKRRRWLDELVPRSIDE